MFQAISADSVKIKPFDCAWRAIYVLLPWLGNRIAFLMLCEDLVLCLDCVGSFVLPVSYVPVVVWQPACCHDMISDIPRLDNTASWLLKYVSMTLFYNVLHMNNFSWRLLSEWTKSLAGSGPLHGRTRGLERQVEFCRWLHLAEYEVGSCGDERLIWVIDGVPKSASQWGRDFVPTALMRRMRGDREGRVIAECCMMSQLPSNIHSHIAPGHMLMAEARYKISDHGGSTRNCTLQHFGFPHFRRRSQSHKLLRMSFWDNPPILQSSFELQDIQTLHSWRCTDGEGPQILWVFLRKLLPKDPPLLGEDLCE